MQDFTATLMSHDALQGVWTQKPFAPGELDNMLPYVKQYLRLPSNHQQLEINSSCLQPDGVFTFVSGPPSLLFVISHISLHVFFNGVGFMSIEIRPVPESSQNLKVEDIERINAHLASLVSGTPFQLSESSAHPVHFADSRTQTAWNIADLCRWQGQMTLKSLIDSLLDPVTSPHKMVLTPMVDRFLPVYGAILLRPTLSLTPEGLDQPFYEFAQHHLTILRKTFTPNNISHFSEIHLDDGSHHYMPYHNVIHSQSLDGGFILAYDNGLSHFAGEHSPAMESFRTSYFYMFLIPYHQRLSILRYAMSAADSGLSPERGPELRQLREEIYDFTSRCYFSQAAVSEERDRLYGRWQQDFHVGQMYNELKEEVQDIDNYLADLQRTRENELKDIDMQRDSRNMQLFALITLVFLPITILIEGLPDVSIVRRWLHFGRHPLESSLVIAGMVVFVGLLLVLILRVLKKRTPSAP